MKLIIKNKAQREIKSLDFGVPFYFAGGKTVHSDLHMRVKLSWMDGYFAVDLINGYVVELSPNVEVKVADAEILVGGE